MVKMTVVVVLLGMLIAGAFKWGPVALEKWRGAAAAHHERVLVQS